MAVSCCTGLRSKNCIVVFFQALQQFIVIIIILCLSDNVHELDFICIEMH